MEKGILNCCPGAVTARDAIFRVSQYSKKKEGKSAFTLSEVLIVISVIGLVAALTIPTLITRWQEKNWVTENDVFKNRLYQGVSQMHARGRLTGRTTTQAFVAELQNFMKITQVCQSNNLGACFTSSIDDGASNPTTYQTATDFNQNWGTGVLGLKLANGSSIILAYNPTCGLDPAAAGEEVAKCSVAAIYDTNGEAGPNKTGLDIQTFNWGEPDTGCFEGGEEYDGYCFSPWFYSGDLTPYNTCDTGTPYHTENNGSCHTDRWAAAMDECKRIGGHLPTGGYTNPGTEAFVLRKYTVEKGWWAFFWSGDVVDHGGPGDTSMVGIISPMISGGNGGYGASMSRDSDGYAVCVK